MAVLPSREVRTILRLSVSLRVTGEVRGLFGISLNGQYSPLLLRQLEAYFSFSPLPTPEPLPWTVMLASVKVQDAAKALW